MVWPSHILMACNISSLDHGIPSAEHVNKRTHNYLIHEHKPCQTTVNAQSLKHCYGI